MVTCRSTSSPPRLVHVLKKRSANPGEVTHGVFATQFILPMFPLPRGHHCVESRSCLRRQPHGRFGADKSAFFFLSKTVQHENDLKGITEHH
ncbi:hypothetical protein XELAEV_18039650mg [Xenopus laevis]|uniref:Uncharacterized protein n=1 Tax=Xenopus laevis TaxID=8355 RepID=A0A974C862_XENLA|nr:hypothetical protein XELAEV_18039650mg [Xenopus laevis]